MFENVRPKIIKGAIHALSDSPLYGHCEIKIDVGFYLQTRHIVPTWKPIVEVRTKMIMMKEMRLTMYPLTKRYLLANAIVFALGEGRRPVLLFHKYAGTDEFCKNVWG